jgi:hypothetical protein
LVEAAAAASLAAAFAAAAIAFACADACADAVLDVNELIAISTCFVAFAAAVLV